ncbi:oxidoreductase [Trichophyton equinum CBS 127.97]|uniref:Oxidoreductase n=1 Tax=Trichophyton equinum (strain ATCC MYA-4606 / CBS 127.97) TaxID=559882 RepID=F2PHF8_TRIEC|nr:oxidoreductase [Trichophyton equinum CBS 127.97]
MSSLKKEYPWIQEPLIICPPMLPVATGELAAAVSAAGGIGFIGLGNNIDKLDAQLSLAAHHLQTTHSQTSLQTTNAAILPVGVGFLNWGVKLDDALPSIKKHVPAAIWLFGAARETMISLYGEWIARVHAETNGLSKVWVQVGSVADALSLVDVPTSHRPDVLVLQGSDAGGHGLKKGAGIITLLPEVHDTLAEKNIAIPLVGAGGIADGRGVAAALCLGADGVAMGTRFLACKQTDIMKGYQDELIRARDGGQTTVRTTIYDRLRGYVEWPEEYDGRGMVNQSYVDEQAGMSDEENRRLYEVEKTKGDAGWGVKGRMTSYAGTGVGLVKAVMTAEEIVRQTRDEARKVLKLDV